MSVAESGMDDDQVDKIVLQSVQNNTELGITGALGFNGRYFCQVLEGDAPTVDALLDKIRKDKRHVGFQVIEEKEIDSRAFPDWAMMRVDNLHIQHILDAMKV